MMLGENQRPQIRRTTSTMRITTEFSTPRMNSTMGDNHQGLSMSAPPSYSGMNNTGFPQLPDFLTTCGLCKGRLTKDRDIYMYRGDAAFCSMECREQQMKNDEKKGKYGVVFCKKNGHLA